MIGRLFKYQTDSVSIQMFRYFVSGTLAYALDYTALATLTNVFRVYYLTSAAIAFILGASVSYALNIKWVFDDRIFRDKRLEGAIFLAISVIGLFLNHYCIMFFTESVKLHYLASKFISTVAVAGVSFSARKYILFH